MILEKEDLSLSSNFKEAHLYLTQVPTYIGGHMTFGFAADCSEYFQLSEHELETRLKAIDGEMIYYTPKVHLAAFALPQYILTAMNRLQNQKKDAV